MKTLALLLAAALLLGLAPSLHAQTDVTVTTTADSGAGSLRQAILSATGPTTITFTPGLAGPIVLSSEIGIPSGKTITVDASALAGGMVIDGGPGTNRIFSVSAGGTLTLTGLTLTGGNGVETGGNGGLGGAIYSAGWLTLLQCSLSGNSAVYGGAIFNYLGALALTNCSFSGNSATAGGAIQNLPRDGFALLLTNCTFSGNSASVAGGAIHNTFESIALTNTIVAGNSAPTGPDISNSVPATISGRNLIGDLAGSGLTAGPTVLVGDPMLSPLGNYGGPIPTMLPLPGSPAMNPSGGDTSSTLTTDQRGSARVFGGIVDIGAVEVGLVVNTTADQLDTPRGPQVSLREAVRDAGTSGMVINFAPTLNGQTITLTPGNGTINLTNNVEINAEDLANGIAVSGASQNFSLFYVPPTKTVAMHNLRITNGGGTAFNDLGGAISLDAGGKLSLTRCTLSGNRTSSTFSGGAIEVTSGSVLTMTDCTLSGNQSGSGGAITAPGNAFPSDVATVILNRCTLSGNQALNGYGGAIHGYRSKVSLTQCTVAGNIATGTSANNGHGGGIFCLSSYLTMNHCTIAGNTANGDNNNGIGGGVVADGNIIGGFAIANTIIAGNTAAAPASTAGPDFHESGNNTGVVFTGRVFLGSVKGTGFFASDHVLTTAENGAVNLAPLGSYGGHTQTMPPLSGSPVVDKAGVEARVGTAMNVSFPTDQRGAPRLLDGDDNTSAFSDLGAAEHVPAPTLVTTTADSGPGSLRQAIAYAAFTTGLTTVTFAPALSGQTITLTSGQIAISATSNVTVDASALPDGLTVSGNNRSGHFYVPTGATFTLRALTLTGGIGANGGAISNSGTLTLTQCSLSGNSASIYGGAIVAADVGGAISNVGTLTLTQCTLSGNSASTNGGAISNSGTLTLTHCTLSGNSATFGGAIDNSGGTLTLTNTIVAGNSAPLAPDIFQFGGSITPFGKNLIGDLSGSGLTTGTTIITGDAKLKPLDNYGGPTQTMQPAAGSPAINAAVGSSFTTDQRGRPILRAADIGACEASANDTTTVTNLAASGPGSLPQILADAELIPGPNIIYFHTTLSGLTLTLTSEIVVSDTGALAFSAKALSGGEVQAAAADDGVTLDASALPGGFTFSGNGTDRLFRVSAGAKFTLKGITLTGGVKPGIGGGALFNDGTLSLVNCTLTGNSSGGTGGAVRNNGTFTATGCAFLNNTAVNNGGAFSNNAGTATFTNCTFSGNSSTGPTQGGGAISHASSAASMKLIHCTIAGNTTAGSDGGGGIRNRGPLMDLQNCILSGNTATGGLGPDLTTNTQLGFTGINYITTAIDIITPGGTVIGFPPTVQNPQLAPLGNYGGPTQTMPPLPGSPVLDQAILLPTLTTDQRGLSRTIDGDGDGIGVGDIGAAEYHLIQVGTRADENDATATLGSGISLREAVRDITPGGTIGFDPALFDGSTATANMLILTLGPLNPQVNCALNAQTIQGGITVLHQPTIYQQPQSLSLVSGTTANFNITVANASGGISTEWRLNGTALVGFPNPAFSLFVPAAPSFTGVFDVLLGELPAPGTLTLTNVFLVPFSALSQPATLIVGAAPLSLLRQPASAMLGVGDSTTLSVVAAGPPPPQPALKYQWFKAGKAIAGATKSSYAIINAQLTHAGAYSCTVSSGLTTVASSTAEIGVVDARPKTVNLPLGAKFIPTVLAAGNGLTYQWKRNGGIVPFAAKSYTIAAVTGTDEGLYTCEVRGLAGTLSNGFNTQLNILTGPPVLGTIALPSAVITQSYFYQIPEAAPTTNRKATSFSVTGLPPGLKCDPLTGIISGRPIATRITGYPLTIKATNLRGSDSEASGIFVIAMPLGAIGTFAGVGARHPLNDNLGARFDLVTSIAGTCSGSVTLGGRAKQPFVNMLLKSFGTSDMVLSAQLTGLKMADTTPLNAQVDINLASNQAQLTLTHPDGSQLVIPAWLQLTNAVQYATKYALALDGESVTNPAQDNTRPQGYGFNTFTVGSLGTLTHAGKLPDGTALSGSTFVGLQGQVLVFQMLYANKGSVVGSYTIAPNSLLTLNTITGSLSWMKPAQLATSTDTVYKAGFGPLTLTAQGGAYVAPLAGQRVLGATSVIAPATNSRLIFSLGGLTDSFTQSVRITNPSATGLTNTAAINAPALNSTTMPVLTASTGAISGSFTLAGDTTASNRPAPWFGQIVTIGAAPRGYGYFLLPTATAKISTSPKLSGRVVLAVP